MPREQYLYPENPSASHVAPFHGVLFRYDAAEHIRIEVEKASTAVEFSTDKTPHEVATAYEDVFGQRIRVDGELKSKGLLLVALKSFRYEWQEPHAPFDDRQATTATVFVKEFNQSFDERHMYLATTLATPMVVADLTDTWRYIHTLRVGL